MGNIFISSVSSLSFLFLSSLSLSLISSTISSITFLPFSGRRHKMTQKGWRVVKPQHNQSIPQRQKSHRVQCIFMFTKTIIIIKIIVYIFIMFTSFESLMIYVIYIVILIRFSLCKLERQWSKFCIRDFGQFLSDVNIDVNGTLPFLKFPLDLNSCIWDDKYQIFTKVIYFGHASFTVPIITEHQYFLYHVTQY